jgi:hypothetical protein
MGRRRVAATKISSQKALRAHCKLKGRSKRTTVKQQTYIQTAQQWRRTIHILERLHERDRHLQLHGFGSHGPRLVPALGFDQWKASGATLCWCLRALILYAYHVCLCERRIKICLGTDHLDKKNWMSKFGLIGPGLACQRRACLPMPWFLFACLACMDAHARAHAHAHAHEASTRQRQGVAALRVYIHTRTHKSAAHTKQMNITFLTNSGISSPPQYLY